MVQLPAGQCSTPAYVAHVSRLRGCDPGRTPSRPLTELGALPWWEYADVESPFGSPEQWRHDDLIGVSRAFDEDSLSPRTNPASFRCPRGRV